MSESRYERLLKKFSDRNAEDEEGGDYEQLVGLLAQQNPRVMNPAFLLEFLTVLIQTYMGFDRRINISRQVTHNLHGVDILLMSIGDIFPVHFIREDNIRGGSHKYDLKLPLPICAIADRKNFFDISKHMHHPFLLTHKFGWELHSECIIFPGTGNNEIPQSVASGVVLQHCQKANIAYCVYVTNEGLFFNHTNSFIQEQIKEKKRTKSPKIRMTPDRTIQCVC
ncbi:hypothetical protein RFI_06749 [Reticulomyxa filosa]|uniref:Uncharacterized protein n=1 Tax=Reticulomyxa filosa TaxID=46433 RepID=X6NWP3_RETFI|nr:hypothetical protein RFI_06749 [Reticulomyxa filosa]|eukprot:ETO30371.1 hypothetical protein RFI_06749 [Reticulomyxa filosa]